VTEIQSEGSKDLWYVGPGRGERREEFIAELGPDEVRVRSRCGAISRGTERLVHAGRVPASEFERMRAPFMGGMFPFPVKYGYAPVGRVEAGPDELQGLSVFALHPHQSLFNLPAEAVFPIPEGVSPVRAVLAANNWGVHTLRSMSVSVCPGATAFTRSRREPSSRAMLTGNASSAAWVAETNVVRFRKSNTDSPEANRAVRPVGST